ncbi:MAG TPA: prepilin-type N-terminal cleavage/methylation domain-containing protein [Thermoanaerobaculia bacterium]|jgi:prepilin-type N-terminal cleavage/methylation domain-containing protein|nr:prepilin-type N-terminal cleavage/methylation domain-containing protein [Thermoanaerobaculia bacterium]
MYRQQRQRGFTLTEVLVATAIFTIIMLAALLMYDRNNRVFKSGVQATDVQQNTRIGFDKLVSDLRIEGFDYNRNGDPSGTDDATGINYQKQPDEQIEYMGDTAIVFRTNLDYNDTTKPDNGRELAYEAPAFPLVTTSNKEIIAYGLQSANPAANTQSISFYADVAKPRKVYVGGSGEALERQVNIPGFDLTNNNPPYTLYRVTLKDANITDNDPNPVGEMVPIATNIRSLKFTYYTDQGGNLPVAAVGGAGPYNSTNATAVVPERDTRKSVQAIKVDLIGMEAAADRNYSSPLETSTAVKDTNGVPVSEYRQYQLSSLIVPRNVGKRAVKEELITPPEPPVLKTICYGACSVPYLTWQAPPHGNVDFYSITYDTDPGGSFSNGYPVGNVTEAYFPRPLDPGRPYYFKIEASNGYGDSISNETGVVVVNGNAVGAINTTTPAAPTALTATTDQTDRVVVTFQVPTAYTTNSPALTCLTATTTPTVPGSVSASGTNAVTSNGIAPPEDIGYRIYRMEGDATFDPNSTAGAVLIASETNGNQPSIDITGKATFVDYVPGCTNYYYRVQAVARMCTGKTSYNSPAQTSVAMSDFFPTVSNNAILGTAVAAAKPATPTNLTLTRSSGCPTVANTYGVNISCGVTLTWDKVTLDTSGTPLPVRIHDYTVTRTQVQPSCSVGCTSTATVLGGWDPLASSGNTVTYSDSPPNFATDASGISYQYQYSVVANSCSYKSDPATVSEPSCYFSISGNPVGGCDSSCKGGSGTAADPYQIFGNASYISFSASGISAANAYITKGGAVVYTPTLNYANGAYSFQFPGLNLGVVYEVDWHVVDASGCYYTRSIYVVTEGGVCDYTGAPTPTPSRTQTTDGLSMAHAWSLQIGDTLTWTNATLASVDVSVIDPSTGLPVTSKTLSTAGTDSFSWPSLTNGKTYKLDILTHSNQSCQREDFYYVTQVCASFGGGTPVFVSPDLTHTGTSVAGAWQVLNGQSITVTASNVSTVKLTVTDVTTGTAFSQVSYTMAGSTATITWPSTGVTAVTNHNYELDFVLVDVNGCTSSIYTRFLTHYCNYSGGTPTISATTTLRFGGASGDGTGTGTTGGTGGAWQMVSNVDMVTVTESKLATLYVDYFDPSTGNALSGVSSKTYTGSGTIKFSNPAISGYNRKVYGIKLTLQDSSGCRSTSYTRYVYQVACLLKPEQSNPDTTIIGTPTNYSQISGGNNAQAITITNLSTTQSITVSALTINFSLPSGDVVTKLYYNAFNNSESVQKQTGPQTITLSTPQVIAANSSITVYVAYNYKPSTTQLTSVCVTYTTSTNTPTSTTTQSCNINYAATGSVSNPTGCD